MTPDQKFARWVKTISAAFLIVFIYFLIADMIMPLTPQAMATRIVTKVAPRVSGQISHVYVHNNQAVKQGDVLFSIEEQPFLLAKEQAKLNVEQAHTTNRQLDQAITAAKANMTANQVVLGQKEREAKRLEKLYKRNGTSQQRYDDATSAATAARANLQASQAKLKQLQVQRGASGDDNLALRIAENHLQQARLNLSYTKVIAEHNGIVTNLQLEAGTAAKAGSPLVALIDSKLDVIADFREKNLRDFHVGSQALVTFDGNPGHLYHAHITSIDAGVSNGQFSPDGNLATPDQSNRWVRDAQRIRIHVKLDEQPNMPMVAGALATVQLVPDNGLLALLAHAQIKLFSVLHYIY